MLIARRLSVPRAFHSMSSEPESEDVEVVFDVPTGGHVVLPVKTRNVEPARLNRLPVAMPVAINVAFSMR